MLYQEPSVSAPNWLTLPPSQTWMDSQGRQGVWGKSLIWYKQQKTWNQRKQRWYRETTSNKYPPRGDADCIQRARTWNHSEKKGKEKTGNTKALLKIKKRKKERVITTYFVNGLEENTGNRTSPRIQKQETVSKREIIRKLEDQSSLIIASCRVTK